MITATDPRHGTEAGHTAHRRSNSTPCPPCAKARARANKNRTYFKSKTPAVGTRRRIQALQAIGWSRDAIAVRLGYADGGSIAYTLRSETITIKTATKVAALYESLSMTVPIGPGPDRARTWARRHGYPPPLAWDEGAIDDPNASPVGHTGGRDDVDIAVVDRVLAGDYQIPTNRPEREEVLRRWVGLGRSLKQLENATGWNTNRYRDKKEEAA